MGAGFESSERPEPLAPSVPEKPQQPPVVSTCKISSLTTKPRSLAKSADAPPPTSTCKPPPAAPRQSSQKGVEVTVEQLSAAVVAAAAPASGSQAQSIVLHVGRAVVAAGEKVSVQLGRVVQLNRGNTNLGALQHLVDRWNLADLTEATRGVGKDGKVIVDDRATLQPAQARCEGV
jgi:hypothetical protein